MSERVHPVSQERKQQPRSGISFAEVSHIGPHKVGEVIGKGSSATVVRSGESALKIFDGEDSRPEDYRAEVRNLTRMHDLGVPNVIPVLDHGIDHINNDPSKPEVPYIKTPEAKGGSLKELLEERILEPEEIVQVVAQVAETLEVMHEHAIVLSDFKPDHILFTETPEPDSAKAPDIWIADLETAGPITEAGEIELQKAATAYAAPEQFGGQNVPQTDIYGLGEVVFEAITGERLWKDGTKIERVEILRQRRHDAYVEDRLELIDGKYRPFKSVLRRALKRNLADRYQRVGSFAEDIALEWEEAQAEKAPSAVTVFDRNHPIEA